MIYYIIMDFNLINTQGDILKRNIKNQIPFNINVKILGKMKDSEKERVTFVMQK